MRMTQNEFLNYLENEKINPIVIMDYLCSNYSYTSYSLQSVAIAKFCNDLGIDTLIGDEMGSLKNGGLIYYSNDIKRIKVSKSLAFDEQRYIILYLVGKFLMHYKYFKNGGEFLATGKLNENFDVTYEVVDYKPFNVLNEKTKDYNNIVYFPTKK